MWGKLAPVTFQIVQWEGDFSYVSFMFPGIIPVLPQLKTKKKSLGGFILGPNLVCSCPVHRRPCPHCTCILGLRSPQWGQ